MSQPSPGPDPHPDPDPAPDPPGSAAASPAAPQPVAEVTEAVGFAEALVEDIIMLRLQVEHLRLDRARRSRIDQACGILMHRYGMDAVTATRTLHRWAQVVVLPLDDVVGAVVTLSVDDDAVLALPREVAHTVSRLLRRELASSSPRALGARSLGRRA